MTFSLYALLDHDSPKISNEWLAAELKNYFRDEDNFSLEFEQLPFAKNKSLALRWGAWLVRVSYEEGPAVKDDSLDIQRKLVSSRAYDVSDIDRRIRVVFGADDNRQYINQIIYLIDFLKEINGAHIFDPQQRDFID